MELKQIKERIAAAIEEHAEEIFRIAGQIYQNPEAGYDEKKTSARIREVLEQYEIPYTYPHALTGVKASLQGKRSEARVCIMGELDAVRCSAHPDAKEGGVVHACGHHAQLAAMLAAAIGMKKSGVMDELDGDVCFFAVPAEEFIDLEYRKSLKDAGKICAYGGKQQLIAEGAFDDIDMAMMVHAQPNEEAGKLYSGGSNMGFLAKNITFRGKAAHGSTPFDGTNALNAAALAILGVHANRETFREEEKIRIHPIITKGGDVVNSVPDEVCIDTYVRGATLAAIKKGNAAVDRAMTGAAQMIGASVEWEDIPGYLPLVECEQLSQIFMENASQLIGEENIIHQKEIVGSTDAGDLSSVLPTIQPSFGGFSGGLHAKEFRVADKENAYILPAKIMANTAAELLFDGARLAKKVKQSFKPQMSKEEYLCYLKNE